MAELILHHYDEAPVAAKVRLAFGIESLAWRSVSIRRHADRVGEVVVHFPEIGYEITRA